MTILVKKIESYKIKFNPKYRDFFCVSSIYDVSKS